MSFFIDLRSFLKLTSEDCDEELKYISLLLLNILFTIIKSIMKYDVKNDIYNCKKIKCSQYTIMLICDILILIIIIIIVYNLKFNSK